jgi:hypothetical protein
MFRITPEKNSVDSSSMAIKFVLRCLPDLGSNSQMVVGIERTLCVNNSETSSPSTISVGAEKDSHLHEQDQW